MKNKPFVRISSFFSGDSNRTVEQLAECYGDLPRLISTIDDLFEGILTAEKVHGKTVLLKPNWVRHSLRYEDDICLRTNNVFLLAALDVVLRLKPTRVVVGDAPIQGAFWDKIYGADLAGQIEELSRRHDIPIVIKDFRRVTFSPGQNELSCERRPLNEFVIFDVGMHSFLEPVSVQGKNPFRVTCYDPDRLAESHRPGRHKYCIAKELFEADIIISLPKVKTHQKAGITAALKNLVGFNGDKDFLPHHRLGGTARGGDCYPGGSLLRYGAELAMDQANRHRGETVYSFWQKMSSLLWRFSRPTAVHQVAAGWYGNDTTWRMVMDLNLIAVYGNADGSLSGEPVRRIFSLCDGIIGGQGNGPLEPTPLHLGCISFSNDSFATDLCWALLMGLEANCIPLLTAAEQETSLCDVSIYLNCKPIDIKTLQEFKVITQMPPGWQDYSSKKSCVKKKMNL